MEFASGGFAHVEVERLSHVDPFLSAGGAFDEPAWVDFEGGDVAAFDIGGDAIDFGEDTVEVFDGLEHLVIPEAALFEFGDEGSVEVCEFAGEVALDVEVFVHRFDGLGDADDGGDGGSGSDGHAVAVAHAVLGDGGADDGPVHA